MWSNKEMWFKNKWVKLLEKDFTVIALDLRGHGESSKSYDPDFYSIDNILNDVESIVNQCDFTEYNLFGHSYGAAIGLQMCKKSNHVKKAICAAATFGDYFYKYSIPQTIKEYKTFIESKKNNTLLDLDYPKDYLNWINTLDLDMSLALFKGSSKWTGVNISDIKPELALYSGTNDVPDIVNNMKTNKDEILKHNIKYKMFDNLTHNDLVDRADLISPWVLDFLLNK